MKAICPAGAVFIVLILLFEAPIALPSDDRPYMGPLGTRDIEGIYWPMIGRDRYHDCEGIPSERGVLDPAVNWSASTNERVLGSTGGFFTSNINFDGISQRDVFGICQSNGTHLNIHDGDGGAVMWSMDLSLFEGPLANSRMWTAPVLVDTDDDGSLEVVAGVTTPATVGRVVLIEPSILLNDTGYHWDNSTHINDQIWNRSLGLQNQILWSSPIAHEITGDFTEDIIIGAGNRLYVLNGTDGEVEWSYSVGNTDEVLSPAAVYDQTLQTRRLIVNSYSPTLRTMTTTALRFNGDFLDNVSHPLGTTRIPPVPMPIIGDVTGDGTAEIVITYPTNLNLNGIRVFRYSMDLIASINNVPGTMDGPCALGDIDDDMVDEMIITSRVPPPQGPSLRMGAYDVTFDGAYSIDPLWYEYRPNLLNRDQFATPLLCDMDSDSVPEVIFPSDGWIYCLTPEGDPFWNLSVPGVQFLSTGLIGDLNSDKFTDVFVGGHLITQQAIDLLISGPEDIYLNIEPSQLKEGMEVEVNSIITNEGDSPATDVRVRFIDIYDGKEKVIGEDLLDEIATTREAKVDWIPEGAGEHIVKVVVDPDNDKEETDETNNEEFILLIVGEAFPDLIVGDINMIRGDGEEVNGEDRHLVDGDPSWLKMRVQNPGQKTALDVTVSLEIDGTYIGSSVIDEILASGEENVSIPWTPDLTGGGTVNALAWADPADTIIEEAEDNNILERNVTVISSDPGDASYTITGEVLDDTGSPVNGAIVKILNLGTGEYLEISTNALGGFSGDIVLLDSGYRDGDEIEVSARSGQLWANLTIKVYSEDGGSVLVIEMARINITRISISSSISGDVVVEHGDEVASRITVSNTGNVAGSVELDVSLDVNSSDPGWEAVLDESRFDIAPGGSREVTLAISVPYQEKPGVKAEVVITGTITGNGTHSDIEYLYLTVNRTNSLVYSLLDGPDLTYDPNRDQGVTYRLKLENTGNVPADYTVDVNDDLSPHALISDGEGDLQPGSSVEVSVGFAGFGSTDLEGRITLSSVSASVFTGFDISIERVVPNLFPSTSISAEPPGRMLGYPVTLTCVIMNEGDSIAGSFSCDFLINGRSEGLVMDVESLPYEEGQNTLTVYADWTPEEVGIYEIMLEVDSEDEIIEEFESDNNASITMTFYPDLVLRSIDLTPVRVIEGEGVTASITVANEGNAPVVGGFIVTLYAGNIGGEKLGERASPEVLDPETRSELTLDILFRAPSEYGSISIYAEVLPQSEYVVESEDSNNRENVPLTIEEKEDKKSNNTLYMVVGIVLLVLIGAGLFLFFRFRGGEIGPPPSDEDTEGDVKAKSEMMPGGSLGEPDLDGEPVLEMALEEPVEEELAETEASPGEEGAEEGSVIIAEVMGGDVEPPTMEDVRSEEDISLETDGTYDEEPMIPEV